MNAFYNEFDPKAAGWLRQLAADDVRRFERVHFFAGIGGWDVALQLAGWPTGRSVFSGSCPCQPYSQAGKRKGEADSRDLWPQFFRIIAECRPETVFGEQVASADVIGTVGGKDRADGRRTWLERIQTDLEEAGYEFGACVLGAHSVGAPHIRQRLYWVARNTSGDSGRRGNRGLADTELQRAGKRVAGVKGQTGGGRDRSAIDGGVSRLADTEGEREEAIAGSERDGVLQPDGSCKNGRLANTAGGRQRIDGIAPWEPGHPNKCSEIDGLVNAIDNEHRGAVSGSGREEEVSETCDRQRERIAGLSARAGGEDLGGIRGAFWQVYQVVKCRDGKTRRIPLEPAFFPLVDGLSPAHMAVLRGSGNAIVPQVAAVFIKAFLEVEAESQ